MSTMRGNGFSSFEYFDFGFAAAVGIVFLAIVACLSMAQAFLLKGRRG